MRYLSDSIAIARKKQQKKLMKMNDQLGSHERKSSNIESVLTKDCHVILDELMKHEHAYPFNHPDLADFFEVTDNFDVIKHPMGLGTIKKRLERDLYSNADEFESHVRLTLSYAPVFNPPHNVYLRYSKELTTLFDDLWRGFRAKHMSTDSSNNCCDETSIDCVSDELKKSEHPSRKRPASADCVKESWVEKKLQRSDMTEVSCLSDEEACSGSDNSVNKTVSEVKVSPSEALRVAKLKNKYSNTICKALKQTGSASCASVSQVELSKYEEETAKKVIEAEQEVIRSRQKQREAARLALEEVERSVVVVDNFKVMREFEALIGRPVALSRLW